METIETSHSNTNSSRSKRSKLQCLITKSFCESLLKENSNRIKLVYYKGRSKVWVTFRRVFVDQIETKFVHCCLCSTILVYESISGTGSLLRHSCSKKQQQTSIQQCSSSNRRSSCFIFEPFVSAQTAVTEAIVLCAAKDLKSLFFTEGKGFISFAQALIQIGAQCGNLSAKSLLPTGLAISNAVNVFYNLIKEKLTFELKSIFAFGLSCEHWVHISWNKVHYFNINIHFIKNGKLCKRLLGIVPGQDDKIFNVISDIDQLLIDFGIKIRKYFFVIKSSLIQENSKFDQLYDICAENKLNQVIEATLADCFQDPNLKSISNLIINCKKLINFCKNFKLASELKICVKQALDIDCGSIYAILELIKDNYDHLKKLSKTYFEIENFFNDIDQMVLNKLCEILTEIDLAKNTLANDQEATYYQVLLIKAKLLLNNQATCHDDFLTQNIKIHLVNNINKHFSISLYHICATLLVPKFRKLNNICHDSVREKGIRFLTNLAKEMRVEKNLTTPNLCSDICLKRVPDDMFEFFTDPILRNFEDEQEDAEVREYFNFNFSINDLSLSPIEFWFKKSVQFPTLNKLATWLHSIPATSVRSKDYYNLFGFHIHDLRNQIASQQINLLTFVHSNLDLIDN